MFCKKCGAKIIEGKKFCADCGTPVAESRKGNKTVLIIAICVAIIATAFAVVAGIKLKNSKPEQTGSEVLSTTITEHSQESSATTETKAPPTETTVTTTEPTTEPQTSAAAATSQPATAKPTQENKTKSNTNYSNSDKLVKGNLYKTIPVNSKTKNIRYISWRGYVEDTSDDMEIVVKVDKNYNPELISFTYHQPSLKDNLLKTVSITYKKNGERMITVSNYLGAKMTYTEDEYVSRLGENGALALKLFETISVDMLCLDPLAIFTEYRPDMIEDISEFKYLGKETIKSGETHKFETYDNTTNETITIWIDTKTGATAKLVVTTDGVDKVSIEANEILP